MTRLMRWGSLTHPHFDAFYFNVTSKKKKKRFVEKPPSHLHLQCDDCICSCVRFAGGVRVCVWGGNSCWGSLSLITRDVFVCSWCPGVVTPLGGPAASLVVSAVKSSPNTLMFRDGGGRNGRRGENLFITSLMGIWFCVTFGSGGNT